MYCIARRINNREDFFLVKKQGNTQAGVFRKGIVEGKKVDDIFWIQVAPEPLYTKEKIQEGSAIIIRCVHGDTVLYPLANI